MIDPAVIADLDTARDAFENAYVNLLQCCNRVRLIAAGVGPRVGEPCSLCGDPWTEAGHARGKCRQHTGTSAETLKAAPAPTRHAGPYLGDPCPKCLQFMLVQTGTCRTCVACQESTGGCG